MIEAWMSALGLSKASVLTGAVGSAVAALRGDGTPAQRALSFTVGFCVAAWGSGAVIVGFGLTDTPTFHGALGFTLGYLGMSIADAAMVAVGTLKALDWRGLIEGWIKKGGGQ